MNGKAPVKRPQPETPQKRPYKECLRIVIIGNITAFTVGALAFYFFSPFHPNPLINTFILDAIVTTVLFLFSFTFNNYAFYDPYWGHIPGPLTIFWVFTSKKPVSIEHILIMITGVLYALRHLYMYFRMWTGFDYQDFRYTLIKNFFGKKYRFFFWMFSYFGFHMFATFIVLVSMWPVYLTIEGNIVHPAIFYFAFLFTNGATLLEHIADCQLYPWRMKKSDRYIDEGLWKYSRHPNYVGEILCWVGFYLMYWSTDGTQKYTWVGALSIYLLFEIITISMMERHLLKKRPIYAVQQKRVSRLWFWFRNEKSALEYEKKLKLKSN